MLSVLILNSYVLPDTKPCHHKKEWQETKGEVNHDSSWRKIFCTVPWMVCLYQSAFWKTNREKIAIIQRAKLFS